MCFEWNLLKVMQYCYLDSNSFREDVAFFESIGVRCVLIGEALMKSPDPKAKINELLGQVTCSLFM